MQADRTLNATFESVWLARYIMVGGCFLLSATPAEYFEVICLEHMLTGLLLQDILWTASLTAKTDESSMWPSHKDFDTRAHISQHQ